MMLDGRAEGLGQTNGGDRIIGLICHMDAISALNFILTPFDHFNDLSYGMS